MKAKKETTAATLWNFVTDFTVDAVNVPPTEEEFSAKIAEFETLVEDLTAWPVESPAHLSGPQFLRHVLRCAGADRFRYLDCYADVRDAAGKKARREAAAELRAMRSALDRL
tara:strand:- start:23328 stop:23663 length:336 start_codon:yes stop_codon:yes gene_type:complete